MKFEDYYNLLPQVKKNLAAAGFKRPTDIQYKAIPSILKGEDVLAIAQTGTGKTAAFAIPTITRIAKFKDMFPEDAIRCVVMVPTRELALQVSDVFNALAKHTPVKTACVFGGVDQAPQIQRIESGSDILITTPGRMFDLVSQGHIKLNRVQMLILDEADRMLNSGFLKDIQDAIKFIPNKRQTLFFSATIDDAIKRLAYSLVDKPVRIQISPKDPVSKNVSHAVSFVKMDDKRFFLERVINNQPEKKILVFVRTKVRAERVLNALQRVNITATTLHGDKDQQERITALNSFKTGEMRVMIATDISARGIDIPEVDIVVNYDLPDQAENYVHRVGRTGRGTRKGQAISFCSPEEEEMLKTIETFITKPINRIELNENEYEETVIASDDFKVDMKALYAEMEQFEKYKKKKK